MPNGVYLTEDLYVASALKTAGLKFIGVSKRGERGIFKFEDSPNREKLVLDFYNGDLVQGVRQYVDNWMRLKKIVSGLNERDSKVNHETD
jgi:hypothetical protein